VPAQAGQTVRINATPSDLPFKSTGFAIYPVPPQFGQSSGSTPLPPQLVDPIVYDQMANGRENRFVLRKTNKISEKKKTRRPVFATCPLVKISSRSYLLAVQEPETFFTLVTLYICEPAEPVDPLLALAELPAEPAPLAPEAVPFTSTSSFA